MPLYRSMLPPTKQVLRHRVLCLCRLPGAKAMGRTRAEQPKNETPLPPPDPTATRTTSSLSAPPTTPLDPCPSKSLSTRHSGLLSHSPKHEKISAAAPPNQKTRSRRNRGSRETCKFANALTHLRSRSAPKTFSDPGEFSTGAAGCLDGFHNGSF